VDRLTEEIEMYHTILVPLDGSARAEKILPHVEAVAQQFGAHLVLAQVVEPLNVGVEGYDMLLYDEDRQRRTQEAKSYLGALQRRLNEQQIEAKAVIESGPVVVTLLDIAGRENADLIALASHGRSGLARVFYGSVAAGILNRTDRPLLLIRAQDD
jgi:nucleotide-binding universal stress UspA family protein